MSKIGTTVPSVTFRVRVRDESVGGDNPFRWEDKTTDDYFKGKRVVVFSLPGAFTPTCSTYQLPGFENNAEKFYEDVLSIPFFASLETDEIDYIIDNLKKF